MTNSVNIAPVEINRHLEQVIAETAAELGCKPDNEEILATIHRLKKDHSNLQNLLATSCREPVFQYRIRNAYNNFVTDWQTITRDQLLLVIRFNSGNAEFQILSPVAPVPFPAPGRIAFESWWVKKYGAPRQTWASLRTEDGYADKDINRQYEAWCGCADTVSSLPVREEHSDDAAFDRFSECCKAKLEKSRSKGRGGWADPEQCAVETLAEMLVSHLTKGNAGTFEDVATFAMMLHQRGASPMVLANAARRSNEDISPSPSSTLMPGSSSGVLRMFSEMMASEATESGEGRDSWSYKASRAAYQYADLVDAEILAAAQTPEIFPEDVFTRIYSEARSASRKHRARPAGQQVTQADNPDYFLILAAWNIFCERNPAGVGEGKWK